jgi:hypothetical protein
MNHLRKLGLASFLFLGLGLFCWTSGAWGPAAAGSTALTVTLICYAVGLVLALIAFMQSRRGQSLDGTTKCLARAPLALVTIRGDRREAIFKDDHDRKLFLEMLGRTCRRTAWEIHAYCLMSNHFHLVVETPRSNLGAGMQWLLGSYTQESPSPD